jgi:ferric-dicitrate binding protein FerR (iron transport regulator)
MTGTPPQHEAVEQRLRAALDARSRTVDPGDLRPAAPPTAIARSHVPLRRVLAVVLGLAAAALCAALIVAALPRTPTVPVHLPPASRLPSTTGTQSPGSPIPTRTTASAAPASRT